MDSKKTINFDSGIKKIIIIKYISDRKKIVKMSDNRGERRGTNFVILSFLNRISSN